MEKINALIFPAGSEIGMEIYNSLKYNLHINIFGISSKLDHAQYIYKESHYEVGEFNITNPGFFDTFNDLLRRFNIDVVFPTHDSIAVFLAEHRDKFTARVLTSDYKTALIAREKKLTYELYKEFDFCTRTYAYPYDDISFPVFLKPNIGQGGKGTCLVHTKEELITKVENDADLIPCEYLPGEELSVDCFSNRKGELLFVGPRSRDRIQMGISFHSCTVALTSEIQEIASTLNSNMQIRGAWFFQVKADKNGRFKLMEFAVRQASTMGLYRQAGVNFALLSIFDAYDIDVQILTNKYFVELDRCLFNRYKIDLDYNRVYIDFDDTIIVENQVNEIALKYLYQCRNKKVKVCLLTKHTLDLDESLQKYCISKNLFDEIILLKTEDDKVKSIDPVESIFIDNYFFDRYRVRMELNIPVFDVDAIESLIM